MIWRLNHVKHVYCIFTYCIFHDVFYGFVIWRVLRGTQDRYIAMCACWDVLFITSMYVLFWVNYTKSLLPLSFSDVLNISILRGHHLGNVEFHHLSARDQWVPLFHPKRLWLATISTKSLDKVPSLNTKYIKDSFPSNFGTLILLDNLNISNFHMLQVWNPYIDPHLHFNSPVNQRFNKFPSFPWLPLSNVPLGARLLLKLLKSSKLSNLPSIIFQTERAPWDGGPLIINPIYTLYSGYNLLGIQYTPACSLWIFDVIWTFNDSVPSSKPPPHLSTCFSFGGSQKLSIFWSRKPFWAQVVSEATDLLFVADGVQRQQDPSGCPNNEL